MEIADFSFLDIDIEGLAQNYCIYNFKIFQEIEKTAQFS